MRSHQIHLKLANLLARNTDVAQLTHAGSDCVRHSVLGDERIHHRARPAYGLACLRKQKDGTVLNRDSPYRFQREIVTVNVKSVQESFQFLVSNAKK